MSIFSMYPNQCSLFSSFTFCLLSDTCWETYWVPMLPTGGQFHQYFWCKSRKVFAQIIIDALKANNIWQKCTEIMTWCKICSLKYAIKFQQKCS